MAITASPAGESILLYPSTLILALIMWMQSYPFFIVLIIAYALIWCIYLSIVNWEINARCRWVERIYDDFLHKEGSRPVLLYSDDGLGAIALQMAPVTVGSILSIIFLLMLPGHITYAHLMDPVGVFLFFFAVGLMIKAIVTLSLRTLFIANNDGIMSVRPRGKGFNVVRSIRWTEVTKVHADRGLGSMVIDGPRTRIRLATNMQNLEPLFRIVRVRVPKASLSEDATEYISVPNWAPMRMIETTRIGYSIFLKAFVCVLTVSISSLFFFVFFLDPTVTGKTPLNQAIAAAVILLPTPLMAEAFLSYFVVSDDGIERCRFGISRVFIPWSEVESVRFTYGQYARGYHVCGLNRHIELTTWLDGMPQFATAVITKVPPERWASAKMHIMGLLR